MNRPKIRKMPEDPLKDHWDQLRAKPGVTVKSTAKERLSWSSV